MKYFFRECTGLALILTCTLFALPVWAQQHEVDRLLLQAIQQNPRVTSAMALEQAANDDMDVARWQRWPTLSASTNMQSGDLGMMLSLQQPLWTGGAITARLHSTEAIAKAAKTQVKVEGNQLALRMLDAWQSLVASHNRLQLQENSLKLYLRYQEMMCRRVKARVSPGIDLEQLLSRTAQASTQADDSRVLKQVAQARLEQLSNLSLPDSRVNGLLEPLPLESLRVWARESTLKRLLKKVPDCVPVRKAKLDAEAARHNLKLVQAQQWPQLSAQYNWQAFGNTSSSLFSIGFTFAPGAGLSVFSQARAQAARTSGLQLIADQVAQDLSESLRVDWENLNRNLTRLEMLNLVVHSSRKVLESYERQFISGRKSWLDVLNALRELTQYEVSRADARAGAAASYYRLRWRSDDFIPKDIQVHKEIQVP